MNARTRKQIQTVALENMVADQIDATLTPDPMALARVAGIEVYRQAVGAEWTTRYLAVHAAVALGPDSDNSATLKWMRGGRERQGAATDMAQKFCLDVLGIGHRDLQSIKNDTRQWAQSEARSLAAARGWVLTGQESN